MIELVFNVVNLIDIMERRKNADYPCKNEHPTIDESVFDPDLKECWVVMGPGIPLVNGTYQFQSDYTKEVAEELCSLINIISGNGGKWATNNMKSAMGLRDQHEKDTAWEDFEEGRKYRRMMVPGMRNAWSGYEYTPANIQADRFRAAKQRIKTLEQEIERLNLILQEPPIDATNDSEP